MAEATSFVFSYKELAEALVKRQNIHEGLWGIYVKFGFGALNVADPQTGILTPSAISAVQEIGIQRFDEPSNLTVNAAEVNPATELKPAKQRGEHKEASRRR